MNTHLLNEHELEGAELHELHLLLGSHARHEAQLGLRHVPDLPPHHVLELHLAQASARRRVSEGRKSRPKIVNSNEHLKILPLQACFAHNRYAEVLGDVESRGAKETERRAPSRGTQEENREIYLHRSELARVVT